MDAVSEVKQRAIAQCAHAANSFVQINKRTFKALKFDVIYAFHRMYSKVSHTHLHDLAIGASADKQNSFDTSFSAIEI